MFLSCILTFGSFPSYTHSTSVSCQPFAAKISSVSLEQRSGTNHRRLLTKPATPMTKSCVKSDMNSTISRSSTPTVASSTPHHCCTVSTNSNTNSTWADQQCAAFAQWLNYMFQPSEDHDHESALQNLEAGRLNVHSLDRAALRTLILHRRIAQARTKAMVLYRGHDMQTTHKVIASEIRKGKLALRPDQDLFADLTLRDHITSLLLSYSTPWLRLGLEAIFDEPINAEMPCHLSPKKSFTNKNKHQKPTKASLSRMKYSLKKFIVTRLLSDPTLLTKYTKGLCKVPSGAFEKKYLEEKRVLTLTRLLDLVFFLDKAKMSNVIDRVPCLFAKKEGKVKSSRDVLVAICRDFLSQEGDVIKHFSRLGLKVQYKQEPVDEIEYNIDNLAVDIRDGVRLARMAEILSDCKPKSLVAVLRLPAVSRLQKLHNIGVALESLHSMGVHGVLDIAAHHIVDGHKEMVLKLMWSVVSHRGLRAIMDPDLIHAEVNNVLRSNKIRRVDWRLGVGKIPQASDCDSDCIKSNDAKDPELYKYWLLSWCNAVCSHFGITVTDFSSSFSDGIALCLLVHFYHPSLLPLADILPTTRHLCEHGIATSYLEALDNEKRNTELALNTLSELGGIPKMFTVGDSENPPEQKTTLLFVAYLCFRLMESSKEILASILIQSFYRQKKRIALLKMKLIAAVCVWRTWNTQKSNYFLNRQKRFALPVQIIESFIISRKPMIAILRRHRLAAGERIDAAVRLQSCTRTWLVQTHFFSILCEARSSRSIQSCWRMFVAKQHVVTLLDERRGAIKIQRLWRGKLAREFFLNTYLSILTMQSFVRGRRVRKVMIKMRAAVVEIQRMWRGFATALQYQLSLLDVITIQSLARRRAAKRLRELQLKAILTLQMHWRHFNSVRVFKSLRAEQAEIEQKRIAAMKIQTSIRLLLAMKSVKMTLCQHNASIILQSLWRRSHLRLVFKGLKSKCISLQTAFRTFLAKIQFQRNRALLISFQAYWRAHLARISFRQTQSKIVKIQCHFRAYLVSRHHRSLKIAIQIVQSVIRRFVACRQVQVLRYDKVRISSVVMLQTLWRSYQARARLVILHKAADCIQALHRGNFVRQRQEIMNFFASIIQTKWRCHYTHRQYRVDKSNIIMVQSIFRRRASALTCLERLIAITVLQCAARQHLASKRVAIKRELIRACKIIQSFWKTYNAINTLGRSTRATLTLQACIRGHLVRCEIDKRSRAALTIQSYLRQIRCTIHFKVLVENLVRLQSVVRRYIVQAFTARSLYHCIVLQCLVRSRLALKHTSRLRENQAQIEFLKRYSAATTLQAILRGHFVRANVLKLTISVTIIQACWRSHAVFTRFRQNLIDIIIIQSVIRRWLVCAPGLRLSKAAVLIQKCARKYSALVFVNSLVQKKNRQNQENRSAVCLQRSVRGVSARISFRRHKAAQMVQKTWRCYTVHVDFILAMISSIMIQATVRGWRDFDDYQIGRYGIIQFQAVVRRFIQTNKKKVAIAGFVSLQSLARRKSVRDRLRHLSAMATIAQKTIRGFLSRVESDIQAYAACEIQRIWRGYSANVDFVVAVIAAIKLQSFFRKRSAVIYVIDLRWQEMIALADRRYKDKKIVKIQRIFRTYIRLLHMSYFAAVIQRLVRDFLTRTKWRCTIRGIVEFQSFVRALSVRRRRSTATIKASERVMQATLRAQKDPSMRLGERTNVALRVLQTSKRLSEIMGAITALETSTRLSRNCCFAFAGAAAPEILYNLIRTCNRSLPHVELLHYVLLTLRNVASHPALVAIVATGSAAEIYMDLIQMFRDKDTIFSLAIRLLEVVLQTNMTLQVQCSTKENLKRLKGVYSLCARKISSGPTRATSTTIPGPPTGAKRTLFILRDRERSDRMQSVQLLRGIISRLEA